MRFCKYCGEEIPEDAEYCPSCGKKVGEMKSPRSEASQEDKENTAIEQEISHEDEAEDTEKAESGRKQITISPRKLVVPVIIGIVVIGAIIFGVTWIGGRCQVSGCNNRAVSGLNYCYSHKCAVNNCGNRRSTGSNYCSFHSLTYDDKNKSSTTDKYIYASQLKISNVHISSNTSYTIAEGTITNNSKQNVKYVQIKGAFKNKSGTVVDTDWTYAVGSEGLAPGETSTWRMSVKKDYSIQSCDVSIIDFNY